jgi:ribosome-associated protein
MTKMPSQIALSQQTAPDAARAAARAAVRLDEDAHRTAVTAARAALDKKAEQVVVLDLRGMSGYTDYLVIGSGTSDRQLEAIAEGIDKELKSMGHRLVGSEGQRGGRWVLLDFGDVVVHIFHHEDRAHYDLEGLWADAPRVPFGDGA